jgi:hypothetical protein
VRQKWSKFGEKYANFSLRSPLYPGCRTLNPSPFSVLDVVFDALSRELSAESQTLILFSVSQFLWSKNGFFCQKVYLKDCTRTVFAS